MTIVVSDGKNTVKPAHLDTIKFLISLFPIVHKRIVKIVHNL